MKEQKPSEELVLELIKKLAQAMASNKEAPKVVHTTNNISPVPAKQGNGKKEALLAKFTSQQKPPKKIVVAEMTTKVTINSFKEAKEVLTTIFELSYNDFAGITKVPDSKKYSFLVERVALLKTTCLL